MSLRGMLRTALWTELSEAMKKDFPMMDVPLKAPPAIEVVVKANADYMAELAGSTGKET